MQKIENGVVFGSKYELVDLLEVLGKYNQEHPDEMAGNKALEDMYNALKDLCAAWKW